MNSTNISISNSELIKMLHDANVRPSVHRLAVLEYIANHRTHPTAEEVFNIVSADFPSVSKTTIYNSLHTLVEAGVLRELEIETGLTRYDLALQTPHSHFRCKQCGKIFDMSLPQGLDDMVSPGFKVDTTDLYFAGTCPECMKQTSI